MEIIGINYAELSLKGLDFSFGFRMTMYLILFILIMRLIQQIIWM